MPRGVYQRDVNVQTTGPDVVIPVDGNISRDEFKINEIEPQRDVYSVNDKAKMLAFMEEPVDIFLQEAANPAEEPAVFLSVSGEPAQPHNPWLLRGRSYTLKRKFVAQLLAARTISYSQPFKADNDPTKVNMLRPQMGMKYPFSVLKDTPEGSKWIQSMMGR